MSSREIAELTGKQHQHVKRDIESMFEQLGEDASSFGRIYFDSMNRQQTEYHLPKRDIKVMLDDLGEVTTKFGGYYTAPNGKQNPCFNLPKRETLILVSGYSVELRARIIDRWQDLENTQHGLASRISIGIHSPRPPSAAGTLPPDPAPMPGATIPAFRLGIRMGGCMPPGLVNAGPVSAAVPPLTIALPRGRSRPSIMARKCKSNTERHRRARTVRGRGPGSWVDKARPRASLPGKRSV